MTCIEKLKEIHPASYNTGIAYIVETLCPDEFDIACEPEWCDSYWQDPGIEKCMKCWEREVEE